MIKRIAVALLLSMSIVVVASMFFGSPVQMGRVERIPIVIASLVPFYFVIPEIERRSRYRKQQRRRAAQQ